MDFIKIKNVCSKDSVKRMKRQTIGWEEIFATTYLMKALVSKLKDSQNSTL